MSRETTNFNSIENTPEGIYRGLLNLREDFDFHIHDGTTSRQFETLHVRTLVAGNSVIAVNSLAVTKRRYSDDTAGIWMGLDSGVAKLYIGNSSNSVKWDGTTLTIVGGITATTGTIGGWTIGATALTSGSGSNTVGLDSGGSNPAFYAGSATPGSAPFRVTQAGALVASSATISGSITITSGSGIGNLSDAGALAELNQVGTGQVDTTIISGGKIVTGLLTASNIQTGTLNASLVTVSNINASNISTGTLSADRISTGSLNANKITSSTITATQIANNLGELVLTSDAGVTIKMPSATSSSGNGGLVIKDSNGVARLKMNNNAFITSFNRPFAAASNTTGTFGSDWFNMFCESDGTAVAGVLEMPNTNRFLLKRSGGGFVIHVVASTDVSGKIDLFEPVIMPIRSSDPSNATAKFFYSSGTGRFRGYSGAWRDLAFLDDVSSESLKTNIRGLDGSLGKILQLNPIDFEWKDKKERQRELGFTAENVKAILPEAVFGEGTYRPTALIPVLVQAIKELNEKIDRLAPVDIS